MRAEVVEFASRVSRTALGLKRRLSDSVQEAVDKRDLGAEERILSLLELQNRHGAIAWTRAFRDGSTQELERLEIEAERIESATARHTALRDVIKARLASSEKNTFNFRPERTAAAAD